MKRMDPEGTLQAALVAYALSRAMFDELDGPDRNRLAQKALAYLPPAPDMPDDARVLEAVAREIKQLGELPTT